jgi:fibronectin type 3 domain-containing protein
MLNRFRRFSLHRVHLLGFIIILGLLTLTSPARSLVAPIRITGTFTGWSAADTALTLGATGPNTNIYYGTMAIATAGAQTWKFADVGWDNLYSDGSAYALNTIGAATWGANPPDPGNYTTTFTAGKRYTVRFVANGDASTTMTIMETDNPPISITAVNPETTSVSTYIPVRVNVTLSAAKTAQENVIVRYTTDGWATSATIVCDSTAATAYYADIPGQAAGVRVIFYVLTSTVTSSANWDLQTIAYNNGAADGNYVYTVQPPVQTHHQVNPAVGVFARGGGSKQFSDTEFISQVTGARSYLTWDTNYIYVAFAGGTGNADSYVVLIDTNPGVAIGAPSADVIASRSGWPNLSRPDVAYTIVNGTFKRSYANTAGSWGAFANAATTCTSYWGADIGTGGEDTVVLGIARADLNLSSVHDSIAIFLHAAWSGGVWANFDTPVSANGLDFLATDSGMQINETTAPGAPTGLVVSPTPTSANDSFAISWTVSSDPTGIGGYYYKVGAAPTVDTNGTFVRSASAAGVKAGPPYGSDTVWVWSVDRNNNRTIASTLSSSSYANTLNLWPDSVVINEVLALDPQEAGAADSFCFVELYNRGATTVDVGNWTITDYNRVWTLPGGTTIGPGKFLVQHVKTGTDYTDSYGAIHVFSATNDTILPGTQTAMNSYALYRSATRDSSTINDFVILSTSAAGATTNDTDAVASGIWTNDSVASIGTFNGVSAVRFGVDGKDTNHPHDWLGTSNRPVFSPGFTNGAGLYATIGDIGANAVMFKQADYATDTTQAFYGDTIYVTLTITTAPSASFIDNIPIIVYSSADTIVLSLRETAVNSKLFIGHFRVVSSPAARRDYELYSPAPGVIGCTTLVFGATPNLDGAADTLSVIAAPVAPSSFPSGTRRVADNSDSLAILAGDTIRVIADFVDNNGSAELLRGAVYAAIRRTSDDSIVLKLDNGIVSAVHGGETLYSVITAETSVSGSTLRCTWTVTPRWTWVSGAVTLSAFAVDSTGLASASADSTAAFYYINALAFTGTLAGTGQFSGAVAASAVFRGSETITWTGLTAVYAGSSISPVDSYFDIRIRNDNGGTLDQSSGATLSTAFAADAATDLTEQDSVYLVNLPTGAQFSDTRASATFIVDGNGPTITVNRDSYTYKGPNSGYYQPGFIDIDFADAEGAIDTAYIWRGGDTDIITSYASPNYTTNFNLSSSLHNNLPNPGISPVIVEAVDSAGNRSQKTIYIAREPIATDGDSAADWQNDEIVSVRQSGTARLTWDDTSFYFSFGGVDGNLANNDWFVYFQTSTVTNADSSYTSHNWAGLGTRKLPFGANFMIGIEDGNIANSEFRSNTGGAWNASDVTNAAVYGGWADIPTTEYRIGWNRFGGKPAWMKVVAFPQWDAAATLAWGAAPATTKEGLGTAEPLTDYMWYKIMADTVPPDTQRVSFALHVNPTTVNVGSDFQLTVSAVNSRGETLPGINSAITLGVSGGGSLGVTTCTFVNGIATISESITNTAGNVFLACTSYYGGAITATIPINVQANISYGWHAASLNKPDTGGGDADSYMRTFVRNGAETMWPRRRTTDNPGTVWVAKDSASVDTATTVTMWYAVRNTGWSSITPSQTLIATDSITYYRFELSQANAAGWDYYESVAYYFRFIQTGKETSFVHGIGAYDNVTDSNVAIGETTARLNPFLYRVKSTAPESPASAISPTDGQTNVTSRRPTLTWRGADDVDTPTGDTIVNYFLEISRTGTWSDTTSFSLDVGWLGSGANSHACTTTLDANVWYYWRVKGKDSSGFDSPWSDTFQFQINAIIAVDGQLNDWNATEKFPDYDNYDWYFTWDSVNMYVAWVRPTSFEDSDVVQCYIDAIPGGSNTTVNFNGGGSHTLPIYADTVVWYRHKDLSAGLNYHYWNGGAWTYGGSVGGSEYKNGGAKQLEFSWPWAKIGAPDSFRIVLFNVNEWSSNYIFSAAPPVNRHGAAPQDLGAYYHFPRVPVSGITPNDRYYVRSKYTWQAPASPATPSFTPYMDGVRDPGWATTPAATSTNYMLPAPGYGDSWYAVVPAGGLCRDVYVTNDAQWLYIGWQAFGDPYSLDAPGNSLQSAHYGFVITDTSAWGSVEDPWKTATGGTKITNYGADVWVNLYAVFEQNTFADANRYYSADGADWSPGVSIVANQDYGGYFPSQAQGWGEVRIPLTMINSSLNPGDSLAIIHYSRHNGYKDGIDDCTPFDGAAASDWAANNAVLRFQDTFAITYRIQQGVIDGLHVPESVPVTGLRKMRTPSPSVSSTDRADIMVRAQPAGVLASATVYYSTDSGGFWAPLSLDAEVQSGGAEFWSERLPTFLKNKIVLYYVKLNSDRMVTYLYGTDTISRNTSVEATAQAAPFRFSVGNTAPSTPSTVDVSPMVPGDADNLAATASGATDSDSIDTIVYRFDWYKNSVLALTTYDSFAPYTSTVPAASTATGESWQVLVSAGDGTGTSAAAIGPAAVIATIVDWPGTAATEANRGRVVKTGSVTEWIWTDKTGEARLDRDDFDIRELRLQTDTNNVYILARVGSFNVGSLHLVVAIDSTLDGSGGLEIGDQTNTLVDSGITSPKARHERQIAIHSVTTGSMAIELDTGGGGGNNWIAPPSGYSLSVAPTAGIIEARVARADLGLTGAATIRVSIAVFGNNIGSAASTNSTSNEAGYDVFDAVSMAAVGLNDTGRILSGVTEDFSDGDLDYSVQLVLSDTQIVPNTQPGATPMQVPATGETVTPNPPTFTWGIPADTDALDTVVAYLFEIADSGTSLDGNVTWRATVLNQYFSPSGFLADSQYYTWRVRGIDRAGQLGTAAAQTFFLRDATSILVNAPTDLQNLNNMRRMNGDEVAATSIRWNWVAAIHSDSAPIVSYVIQIDTSTNFTSPVDSITLPTTSRIYTWTSAQRGNTYYARILAVDTGGFVGSSPTSDGIYVSRRDVNGDSSDWAPSGGQSDNTANWNSTFKEGVWKDGSNDQRGDVANSTSRDLVQFHVTADPFNIYFLVPTQAFVDGATLGQIAISYDASSDNRALQGNSLYAEDSFTTTKWSWERLVRWRTGNDDCYALNAAYSGTPARYTENTTAKFVELCVPLSAIDGADKILGREIAFTVATFYNNGGGVGTNGVGNSNVVDAVSSGSSTWPDEISGSDPVVNYALLATFDTGGRVTAFSGSLETASYAPPLPGQNGEVQQVERDLIMYNVFVDRFVSGRSDNAPSDPNMTGGDLQGLMDSMSYFNTMGFNCIYTSPLADFGGGAWGYNQNDLYGLQYSFSDPNSRWYRLQTFVELAKKARNHNIKIAMDWVPGQIAIGRTLSKYPEIVASLNTASQYQRFGSQRVREYSADARQFFVDHSLTWCALGAVGLRADNTKFYQPNDDPPNGMPFYRYMRKKWDEVYPTVYVFGEQPGGASDIAGYVNDGKRMDGQLDFPIRENIKSWILGNTTPNFISGFTGNEASYGQGVMAGFIENHDHSRWYHWMSGGGREGLDNDGFKNSFTMSRIRSSYMFSSLHSQPVVFMYGDEVPITGCGGDDAATYPFPPTVAKWIPPYQGPGTEQQGQTRAFPWNWPDGTWLRDHLADYFTARCVFSEMRGSNGNRDLSSQDADNNLMRYRRGTGDQQRVVGYINKSGGAIGGITMQLEVGGTFRDWIHPGDATQNGWVASVPDNGRLWVQAGFGRYSLHVDAGEPNVIVSVDNNTAWTNITGTDGKCWINRVMTAEFGGAGTEYRTLYWWKPGYTVHSRVIHLPIGGGDLGILGGGDTTVAFTTPDMNGPPTPSGLAGVSRNHAAWLRWEPVYDFPTEDPQSNVTYKVYRSRTPNNPSPDWIIETLQPWFYDNNSGDLLTNGDTYYYRVVACDRNGNPSGYSNEVRVVPNTITVKFYFTTEGITDKELVSNPTVKIGGNMVALGDWTPITMTALDTGMWYFECQMDPEIMPEYKFVFNDEWEWNNVFYSNDVSYERHDRPRLIKIVDHTGERVAVFTNKWNVDGDVAPRQVWNTTSTGGDTFISIGWTPNREADVNRYIIRRSTDAATWTEIGDAEITQNTFTDSNVVGGTVYYYQVRAVDWWNQGGNWSTTTSAQLVSSDVQPPSKPQGLTLAPIDTGTIRLTWSANSEGDMAGYYLYRSTDPNVPATLGNRASPSLIAPSLSPSYTDAGVTTGVRYYYKLVAVDYAGNTSTASDTATAYIVALTLSCDLANVIGDIEVSGNVLSLGPSPARITMPVISATVRQRTFGVFAGQTLQYRYSYNSGASIEAPFNTGSQQREYSPPEISAITLEQDWEDAPQGTASVSAYAGNQTAYLQWTADSSVDVMGYTIERSTASDSIFRLITGALTTTTYTDTGLTNNETYFYIVRSIDGGEIQLQSGASRVTEVTPRAPIWIRFRVDVAPPERRLDLARRRR